MWGDQNSKMKVKWSNFEDKKKSTDTIKIQWWKWGDQNQGGNWGDQNFVKGCKWGDVIKICNKSEVINIYNEREGSKFKDEKF